MSDINEDSVLSGSPEFRKNEIAEPLLEQYVYLLIAIQGYGTREDLVDGGAFHADCSQEAVKRYLKKRSSLLAPLFAKRMGKTIVWIAKPGVDLRSLVPADAELEAKIFAALKARGTDKGFHGK